MAAFDLLAIARRRARHQRAGLLLDPPERGDVVVRAEQDPGLACAGLRREIGLPLDELVRARREPARHLRGVAVAKRSLEHRVGKAVDLDEDDARPVGVHLLARASSHPLDHAQRVRVVVVDAEGDLEYERRRGGGECTRERPAECVDHDGVADRAGSEPEDGRIQDQNDQKPLRIVNGSRIRAMAGTASALRIPTTPATRTRRGCRRRGAPAAAAPQSGARRSREPSRPASCGALAPVAWRPTRPLPLASTGLSSRTGCDPAHRSALTRCGRAARLRPSDARARRRARGPASSGAVDGRGVATSPSYDSSVLTNVPPCVRLQRVDVDRLDPERVPVQAVRRGASTSLIVDVIVPGPAFQRNSDPSSIPPSNGDGLDCWVPARPALDFA